MKRVINNAISSALYEGRCRFFWQLLLLLLPCGAAYGQTIANDVTITTVSSITEEIRAATRIEGNLSITVAFSGTLVSNADLQTLQVEEITGNLSINFADGIIGELNAFNSLRTIGGSLRIENNGGFVPDNLTAIAGFTSLTSIGGEFKIFSNSDLESISGFDNLRSIGTNPSLGSTAVRITIQTNGKLSSCCIVFPFLRDPLPSGYTLGGSGNNRISIQTNMDGSNCASISAVKADATCDPCRLPTCLASDVVLDSAEAITETLKGVTTISGSLTIGDGDRGRDIKDLDLAGFMVQEIGGHLKISGSKLTDFTAFTSLRSIGDSLVVSNNTTLTSLPGFPSLRSIGVGLATDKVALVIKDNAALATCCGLQPFLAGTTDYVLGGSSTRTISGNATGCESATVISGAAVCPHTLSVSATSFSSPYQMGSRAITITISGNATGWTATRGSGDTFVTFGESPGTTTAMGTGTGRLQINYTANTGTASRTATITIATSGNTGTALTATITLTQGFRPADLHSLSITSSSFTVETAEDENNTASVRIPAAAGSADFTIDVGDGATSWTATELSDPSDVISNVTASGNDLGTLTVTYTQNETQTSRVATVELRTVGTGTSLKRVLLLTQVGGVLSITGFSPQVGFASDEITITGTGFSTTAAENAVVFGGEPGKIHPPRMAVAHSVDAYGTELKVRIHSRTERWEIVTTDLDADGNKIKINNTRVKVMVGTGVNLDPDNGSVSSQLSFAQVRAMGNEVVQSEEVFDFRKPSITSFEPLQFRMGEAVIITGEGFSATASENRVVFRGGNTPTSRINPAASQSPFFVNEARTKIRVRVPIDAQFKTVGASGRVHMVVGDGRPFSSPAGTTYTLKMPRLTGFRPPIAGIGDEVTIIGENFGTGSEGALNSVAQKHVVSFGGTSFNNNQGPRSVALTASEVNAEGTELKVTLPRSDNRGQPTVESGKVWLKVGKITTETNADTVFSSVVEIIIPNFHISTSVAGITVENRHTDASVRLPSSAGNNAHLIVNPKGTGPWRTRVIDEEVFLLPFGRHGIRPPGENTDKGPLIISFPENKAVRERTDTIRIFISSPTFFDRDGNLPTAREPCLDGSAELSSVCGQLIVTQAAATPTVTSFTPATARVGDEITITGTNFSTTAGENHVQLGGSDDDVFEPPLSVAAHEVNTEGTELKIRVPSNSSSVVGKVKVLVETLKDGETGIDFASGSDITISDTRPSDNPYQIAVSGADFTLITPTLAGFSPTSFRIGELITITGTNFSSTASNNAIQFGGTSFEASKAVAASSVNPAGTQLQIRLPYVIPDNGPIWVRVGASGTTLGTTGTVFQSSDTYTFQAPEITSFSPAVVATGNEITILGENFATGTDLSPTGALHRVSFGGDAFVDANAEGATVNELGTELKVSIPPSLSLPKTGKLWIKIGERDTLFSATDLRIPDFHLSTETTDVTVGNNQADDNVSVGVPSSSGVADVVVRPRLGDWSASLVGSDGFFVRFIDEHGRISNYSGTNSHGASLHFSFTENKVVRERTNTIRLYSGADANRTSCLDGSASLSANCRQLIVTQAAATPTVTSFTPATARVGDEITITGTNFSTTAGENHVQLGGSDDDVFEPPLSVAAHEVNTEGTEIKIRVPSNSSSVVGKVKVLVETLKDGETGIDFASGSDITISDTRPSDNPYQIAVSSGDFTLISPTFTGFSPTSFRIGELISITGTNFSSTASDNAIQFGGTSFEASQAIAASSVNPDSTQLQIRVPYVIPDNGSIWVRVGASGTTLGTTGLALRSSDSYTFQAPEITSFSPSVAGAGEEVTISGSNFATGADLSPSGALHKVSFGGAAFVEANAQDASVNAGGTELKVSIPLNSSSKVAETGRLHLKIGERDALSSASDLTIPDFHLSTSSSGVSVISNATTLTSDLPSSSGTAHFIIRPRGSDQWTAAIIENNGGFLSLSGATTSTAIGRDVVTGNIGDANASNDSLTISYAQNGGSTARTATIRFSFGTDASIRTCFENGVSSSSCKTLTLTQAGGHSVSVPTSTYEVTAAEGSVSSVITIGNGADMWSASSSEAFVTFGSPAATTAMGANGASLQINYAENTITTSRSATITLTTSGTGATATTMITLTQAGIHSVSAAPATHSVQAASGSVSSTIDIEGGATGWRATAATTDPPSGASFITFGTGMDATTTGGDGASLQINYAANEATSSRTATITITTTGEGSPVTTTITLTQAGIHTVSVERSTYDTTAAEGEVSNMITIGGSATGWRATRPGGAAFISFGASTEATFEGTGSGSLQINFAANEATDSRTATITITTTGDGNSVTTTIILTQAGAHAVSAAPDAHSVTDEAGNVSSTITLEGGATGWTAERRTGDTFITFGTGMDATATGANGASLRINYAANESTTSREAVITLRTTGEGTSVSSTIRISQAGAHAVSAAPATHSVQAASGSVSSTITIEGGATGWRATAATTDPPSGASFITFGTGMDATTTGGDGASLQINYAANEATSSRTATITITTTGEGEAVTTTITLTQAGIHTVSVERSTYDTTAAAGEVSNMITIGGSATGWRATRRGGDRFITFGASTEATFEGTGSGSLQINFAANEGTTSRTATITITTTGEGSPVTTTIMLRQAGAHAVSAAPDAHSVQAAAGNVSSTITIEGGATGWSAAAETTDPPSGASFITFGASPGTTTATGGDGASLQINYAANEATSSRTATITITTTGEDNPATTTIMLTQTGIHTVSASRSTYDTTAVGGNVTPTITIGGSAMGWRATRPNEASFISFGRGLEPTARGTGTEELIINFAENESTDSRMATITITTTGDGSPVTTTITLTQAGAHAVSVSRSSYDTTTAGGSVTPTITIDGGATGWQATATTTDPSDGASFITFGASPGTTTASGTETGPLRINYAANEATDSRTATITITTTGDGEAEEATIMLRQAGLHFLSASRSSYDTSATGGSVVPTITIGGGATGWRATRPNEASFISFGAGEEAMFESATTGPLQINYTANESTTSRTATITITTTGEGVTEETTIMLRQAGLHILSVSRVSYDTTAAAGSVMPTITIDGGATGWRANKPAEIDYITFGSDEASMFESTSTGELLINYTANLFPEPRTATITIRTIGRGASEDTTITLTQAGRSGTEAHTVSVSRSTYDTTTAAGSLSPTITIGGGATGWRATRPAASSFISFGEDSTSTASGTGTGTLLINYLANEGTTSRTATITITTIGDGTAAETTISITQAGTDEVAPSLGVASLDEGLVLYPNPASNRLYIGGLRGNALVRISTIGGVIVQRADVSLESSSVDVSSLGGGTYVVVIESAEGVLSRRLVIIQ